MQRRDILKAMTGGLASGALPAMAAPLGADLGRTMIGAAWRGPRQDDPHFVGTLVADWANQTLRFGYTVAVPARPHGILPEPGGGMLVCAHRPGVCMMRCDGEGQVLKQQRVDQELGLNRLSGHAVVSADGQTIFTTETDYHTLRGKIGVRDYATLEKLDEWDTHGMDPHELLLDGSGHLIVANGGVPRDMQDHKLNLNAMDSSLVRLDHRTGELLGQWRVSDRRLSLRHMAWNHDPKQAGALLGLALQAEHAQASRRSQAPILAVFNGTELYIPTTQNDGVGYCGDIAAAYNGGFALSSHLADSTYVWHPAMSADLQQAVKLPNCYALSSWHGPQRGGGFVVATALGLGRIHPHLAPTLLTWPEPMALDNHWVVMT
jgi:uncharacterized protein